MKRRLLLLALMTIAGILLSSLSENQVNACGKNSTRALAVKKCCVRKAPIEISGDADQMPDRFMNPFTKQ